MSKDESGKLFSFSILADQKIFSRLENDKLFQTAQEPCVFAFIH